MDAPLDPPAEDVAGLRRCLNDLMSIMALPALWAGGEPAQIIGTLLDALRQVCRLAFVFARLSDYQGGPVVEMARAGASAEDRFPPARAIGEMLDRSLGAASSQWPSSGRVPLGGGEVCIASVPLGIQGEFGIVVAGCRRSDFPTPTDRLLLDVAANQAAIGLQQARLLSVQRQVAGELNERVAQRTGDLTAANEELRREVAERQRIEDALRETERESRSIINTIPALAWSARIDGSAEFFNQHYLDFVGFAAEQASGHGWTAAVHPDDLHGVLATWRRIVESEQPGETEVRLRRQDGEYRWFLLRANPLRDETGRVVKWYGINTDIEQRKQAEEALHRARSDLAEVARATALSTLTASIAHEVNQPLSGIITNASTCARILDADPPNVDEARETLKRTIRDGHRASEVIARLRALFSGKAFTPELLDLNEATREVLALSSRELQMDRLILQADLAEDLPPVTGDRIQLQQVMLNFLRNAAEAMRGIDDRPRRLQVRTERDGGSVRVTVRDTGVGIDPRSLDKLFNAFHTTKPGGMGIGLSISRSIVERHHGRIWAEPNDGPGATFAFAIPIHQQAGDDTAPETGSREGRAWAVRPSPPL